MTQQDALPSEVRYERLRPTQLRARREACPVAYLPIGTIEWHGHHNPVGLDTLKAHALAVRCAEANGGLVFPSLWYGENRSNALLETSCGCTELIADAYGIPADNFKDGYMGRSIAEQNTMYNQLLIHMLLQIQSLGFKVVAICAGHYPLIDHAKAACHLFHQHTLHIPPDQKLIPWVFTGYELVGDEFWYAGDHAAYWETSLMMALDDPAMVDLSVLPETMDGVFGVGGHRPPHEATREAGLKYVERIVEKVGVKIRDRLDRHQEYMSHNLLF